MTDKCVSRKTPCETAKICNPTSGRCVLKSGKIGLALLKGGENVQKPSKINTKYMKKEDIIAKFPQNTNDIHLPEEFDEHMALKVFRQRFGPSVQLLTKKLAKQLRDKKVYMVYGQGWDSIADNERAHMLVSLLIHKVNEDDIESTWGDLGENNFIYFTPYDEYAVTGSGLDFIFVFVSPKKVSFANQHGSSLTQIREIPSRRA